MGDAKLCIDLKNGDGSTKRSEEKADVTLTMKDEDFAAMADGTLDGMQAFMSGKLKVSGNMMLAQKLATILESARPWVVRHAPRLASRSPRLGNRCAADISLFMPSNLAR